MEHSLGLRGDGTVVAAGEGLFGSCAVGGWTDICAIAAGHIHSLGLGRDGKLRIADAFAAPGAAQWTDLQAVAVSAYHTVGLRRDGTVVASGDTQYGQCDTEDWTGVTAIAAGERHTLGLREDGSVVAVGDSSAGQCAVSDWKLW